jgi:hypothetical protein
MIGEATTGCRYDEIFAVALETPLFCLRRRDVAKTMASFEAARVIFARKVPLP